MTNKKYVMSHNERLFDAPKVECDFVHPEEVEELVLCDDLVNGIKVSKTEVIKKKIAERDGDLQWYDFSLDSLVSSGAISNAKFSTLSGDPMTIADQMDESFDLIADKRDVIVDEGEE